MIITTDNIREFRPIAQNIDDVARIEPYIREAELLNVLPVIGSAVYRFFDETDFTDGDSWIFATTDGKNIEVTREMYEAVINGGYYSGGCNSGHSMGLAAAISYYAYSRAIMNNQVNVTSFGVVRKRGEYSEPVDSAVLVQVSREAKKMGDEILREVVEQLSAYGLVCGCRTATQTGTLRKWQKIGK